MYPDPNNPMHIPAIRRTMQVNSPEELRAAQSQMVPSTRNQPPPTHLGTFRGNQNPQAGGPPPVMGPSQSHQNVQTALANPNFGALSVPQTDAEKNIGYAATAAPFIGAAMFATPLAPIAAAFGIASLAEQYLGNKATERNPSQFPAEWDKFPEKAKLAHMAANDPVLAAQMTEWEAATGEEVGTNDMQNYKAMKDDPNGPKSMTEYMTKYRHKAEGQTTDIQNAAAAGMLLPYFQSRAGVTETGTKEATHLTARNEVMQVVVEEVEPQLIQAYENTQELIAMFESGKYAKAGPITGRVMRFFDEDLAGLDAESIGQMLENMKRVNLAPISEGEIKLVMRMGVDPEARTPANIGRLKVMLKGIEKELRKVAPRSDWYRQHQTMKGFAPTITRPWENKEPPPPGVAPAGAANPSEDPLLTPVN